MIRQRPDRIGQGISSLLLRAVRGRLRERGARDDHGEQQPRPSRQLRVAACTSDPLDGIVRRRCSKRGAAYRDRSVRWEPR